MPWATGAWAFAFYPHDATPAGEKQATWSTLDANESALQVTPGSYEHRHWGFTMPGTYVFQVHAKGPSEAALYPGATLPTR